jgi:glucose-6-phosphate 1-epimerase
MTNFQQLNEQFGGDRVRFEEATNGLVRAIITTPNAQGEVYLHGAHLTHFQPAGQAPLLFLSNQSHFAPDKPIRGGVPICFPWFGPRQGDASAPMHGLARLLEWEVESVETKEDVIELVLSLSPPTAPHPGWPTCALRFIIQVGQSLQLQLEVTNTGASPFAFEEALHTYFQVGDAQQIEIAGLAEARYLDKTDGLREKTQLGARALRINEETDQVYLNHTQACVILDPVLRRKIHITKENSQATVVWNPWIQKAAALPDFGDDEWTKMVCIETCNVNNCEVEVQPGQSHIMTAKIEVETL